MKKKNVLTLLSLAVISGTLASCSFFSRIITNKDYIYCKSGVNDVYTNVKKDSNKTKLKYTYDDLYDNYVYDVDKAPTNGNVNLLVIPVWFDDSSKYISSTYKENVRQDIYDAFFGDESVTGWRSVAGYYKQESFNQLNIQGTVTEWWAPGKQSTEFTSNSKTSDLVDEAVKWYKKNNNDITAYDSNKDGYIDGVILIYGSPDYTQDDSIDDNMWAYTFWTQNNNASLLSPNANAFLWASFDFMYGYNTYRYGKKYGYGDTSHCSVDAHTYIHEFGHVIGLQDYYDYALSGSTTLIKQGYEAAGGFSMQDYNIGGHDPFSKLALGWTDPYVVTDSCTLTIEPSQQTGDVILISNNYNESAFDEYLLLELYTPTGLNEFDTKYSYCNNYKLKGPTGYGIRLWHVDARIATPSGYNNGFVWSESKVGTNPTLSSRYGYYQITTNTSKTKDTSGYYSELSSFVNYRTLQLIRNGVNDYSCGNFLSNSDFFTTGSTFSMSKYSRAFVNNGKFNNGSEFNFEISFDKVTSSEATITITKK